MFSFLSAPALSGLFASQSQISLYSPQQPLSSSGSEASLRPPGQPLWRKCNDFHGIISVLTCFHCTKCFSREWNLFKRIGFMFKYLPSLLSCKSLNDNTDCNNSVASLGFHTDLNASILWLLLQLNWYKDSFFFFQTHETNRFPLKCIMCSFFLYMFTPCPALLGFTVCCLVLKGVCPVSSSSKLFFIGC